MPARLSGTMTVDSDTVEGFTLIKSQSGRVVLYRSPELNLFVLITKVPCEVDTVAECGIWHSDIVLGEQPAGYFEPPAGVKIVRVDKPGGIIRHNGPPVGVQ